MEDKQIYTTARSEEIKRKLISLKKELLQKYDAFKKEREKKASEKQEKIKQESTTTVSKKAKNQNVQIKLEDKSSMNTKVVTPKIKSSQKDSLPFISEERLFQIATYTIFSFIVIIIVLGIYLTYKN